VSIWNPYKLKHIRVKRQPFVVSTVFVHQPRIFPVLSEVQNRGKLLKNQNNDNI
jgi:hypothetical protein